MTYRIYECFPRYDRNTDAILGAGYRQVHPYSFETLGLALKLRSRYLDREAWELDGVAPVVLDSQGRERHYDPSREPAKPEFDDEIPV